MAEHRLWSDGDGRFFVGEYGTTEITADEAIAYLHSSGMRDLVDGPARHVVILPVARPPITRRQVLLSLLASLILAFLISAACLWGPR